MQKRFAIRKKILTNKTKFDIIKQLFFDDCSIFDDVLKKFKRDLESNFLLDLYGVFLMRWKLDERKISHLLDC